MLQTFLKSGAFADPQQMFQHVKATANSLQRPDFPTMFLDGNQDFLLQSLLLSLDFSRHSTLNWHITYSATTNVIGLCSLQFLGHNSTSFQEFVSLVFLFPENLSTLLNLL